MKSPAESTCSHLFEQLSNTLSGHQALRDSLLKLLEDSNDIKARLATRSGERLLPFSRWSKTPTNKPFGNVAEFMATLQGSTCERVPGKTEFLLDLYVKNDPTDEALASRSFVLSEHQMSALLDDMDKIRKQLFHAVT